jgi:hypothetical protein
MPEKELLIRCMADKHLVVIPRKAVHQLSRSGPLEFFDYSLRWSPGLPVYPAPEPALLNKSTILVGVFSFGGWGVVRNFPSYVERSFFYSGGSVGPLFSVPDSGLHGFKTARGAIYLWPKNLTRDQMAVQQGPFFSCSERIGHAGVYCNALTFKSEDSATVTVNLSVDTTELFPATRGVEVYKKFFALSKSIRDKN